MVALACVLGERGSLGFNHKFMIEMEEENGFDMVTMQPAFDDNVGGLQALRTDPGHPWPSYIAASVMRTKGEKTVELPNSGGSICNYIFQDTLGLPLFLETAFLCRMLAACTARIYSKKSDARGYCDHGRRLLGYRPPCGISARTELTS